MKRKIIAIANQKGGVGKTTTVVNIAAALAVAGRKVMCIDLDSQGNLSDYLGYEGGGAVTITELLKSKTNSLTEELVLSSILKNQKENINFIPADLRLAGIDNYLFNCMNREYVLKKLLSREEFKEYDYILLDCSPSLNIVVTNALAAADSVIVPVQLQKFSLDGIRQFEVFFNDIKEEINENITIEGILETMVDNTNIGKSVHEALNSDYDKLIFRTTISRLKDAGESNAERISLINKKNSRLGEQYKELASEIIAKEV